MRHNQVWEGLESSYQPGSTADFDRLYEATYQRLFGTIVTLLGDRAAAEDCVQEAYLRAFAAWGRWRATAPAEAWIFRIAFNVAASHRRREALRRAGALIRRLGVPDPAEPPPDAGTSDLIRELRALPRKQSAALVLRHVHGYTNREIAHALGVPERTVASRLAAARARLQIRLRLHPDAERLGTSTSRRVPFHE